MMRHDQIRLDLIGMVDWEKTNLAKLQARRIDAVYFSNCDAPRYYAAQDQLNLKLIDLPVPRLMLYGAFGPSASASLVIRYAHAAKAAFADGRFDAYLERALHSQGP